MKNNNKGFTLIELLVSFAVLAIISGALLQMFVVSSKTNRQAYDMDKATALTVKVGEEFKANPRNPASIPELAGASFATDPSGAAIYARELNGSLAPAVSGDSIMYRLVVTAYPVVLDSQELSYYPEPIFTQDINTVTPVNSPTCTVTISNPLSNPLDPSSPPKLDECKISVNGTDASLPLTSVKNAVLPIRLNSVNIPLGYSTFTVSHSAILLVDSSGKVGNNPATCTATPVRADLYISNIPEIVTPATDPPSYYIIFNAADGISGYTIINTAKSNTGLYSIRIQVIRINDSSVLTDSTVKKYYSSIN